MKKLTSLATFVLLVVLVNACAPAFTAVSPTITSSPSSTPTITFTPVVTPSPPLTITPSPFPSSTASYGFRRISINHFIPNLSFEIPISFEIPQDYRWRQYEYEGAYNWMSQNYTGEFRPRDMSYFEAMLAPDLTYSYDSQSDRFSIVPNSTNDTAKLSLLEEDGGKLNRLERKKIGEFPVLIIELELPYETDSGVVTLRQVNSIYIATLIDKKVLWIDYYFSLPANFAQESAIWEHFKSSLERN